MTKLLNSVQLVSFLLVLVTVINGSITWRRVTRPKYAITQDITTETVPSSTKSPITWKRSTLSRRSTRRDDPPLLEEEDDIDTADSKEEVSILEKDTEQEHSIKPLTPGSRPGFWFDSTRRKKPSALLKPGSRRNSLFPTKSSTVAVLTTSTDSVTPVPVVPLTPPASIAFPEFNTSSKLKSKQFGRNRSTKSPITFRRRQKTTKVARVTSTTVSPEVEEMEKYEEPSHESEIELIEKDQRLQENDLQLVIPSTTKEPYENKENNPSDIVRLPKLGIRRRLKNGTRAPWIKDGGRLSSRTSPTPQPKSSKTTVAPTTVSTTQSFSRSTRRPTSFPRVRSRTRASTTTSPPQVSWAKNKPASTPADKPSTKLYDTKHTEKVRGPTNYLRNRNVHKFNRVKPNLITEKQQDIVLSTTTEASKDYELIPTTQGFETNSRTAVAEPFYITRDYGELVTAVPEVRPKKKFAPTRTTSSSITVIEDNDRIVVNEDMKDIKKSQYVEANETNDDIINEQKEVLVDNSLNLSAVDETFQYQEPTSSPLQPHHQLQRITTPRPSITIPTVSSSIDPGANAYVVWSLGHGGHGWSYEKQGGQVKWSAQNSQAEGDRWSVQGKDEPPSNYTSDVSVHNQKERILSTEEENKVPFVNVVNSYDTSNWKPVRYIPNGQYRNETPLKITTPADFKSPSLLNTNNFSPFPPGITNFSPIVLWNTTNNFLPESNSVSTTASIFTPVLSTNAGAQQNETDAVTTTTNQITSINTPYIDEIAEIFNNSPDFVTVEPTSLSNFQEYHTETPKAAEERLLPTTTLAPPESNYGLELEYGFPKSTHPSFPVNGIATYGIEVPEFFTEEPIATNPSFNPSEAVGHQGRDLSGIPPELAKAVVDAKRWTVVGTGGTEGWSLLGENGDLEWKIHNTDGKWKVTSADELLKLPLQVSVPFQTAPNGDQTEEEKPNAGDEEMKLNSPRIWKLEDDYAKWKVLSEEGGVQLESPLEKITSNTEYDYDHNDEYEKDYYDDEDDYHELSDKGFFPLITGNFEDRPLWGTGENKMIRNYAGGHSDYSQFGGEIESINTKEDAIAAWKSLLAEQGNWKLSKEEKTTSNSKYHHTNPSAVNSGRKVSSKPQRNFEESVIPVLTTPFGNNGETQEITSEYERFRKIQPLDQISSRFTGDLGESKKENSDTELIKQSPLHHKDHSKIDTLINKLENIQKEAKGKAVVDLAQLLKLIKTNRNFTAETQKVKQNAPVRNRSHENEASYIQSRHKTEEHQESPKHVITKLQQQDSSDDKLPSDIHNKRQLGVFEKNKKQLKKSNLNFEQGELVEKFRSKNRLPSGLNNKPAEEADSQSWPTQEEKYDGNIIYLKQTEPVDDYKGIRSLPSNSRNKQKQRIADEYEAHQIKSHGDYDKTRIYTEERELVEDYRTSDNYAGPENEQKYLNDDARTNKRRIPGGKIRETETYKSKPDTNEKYKIINNVPSDLRNQKQYMTTRGNENDRRKPGSKFEEKIIYKQETEHDYQFDNENRQRYSKQKPKRKQNRFRTPTRDQPKTQDQDILDHTRFTGQANQHVNENYQMPRYSENNNSENKGEDENKKHHTSRNRRKRPQGVRYNGEPSGIPRQYKVRGGAHGPDAKLDSSEKFANVVQNRPQLSERYEQKHRFDEDLYESSQESFSERQRQLSRERYHKHNNPPPIVISSETEIIDDEDGSKKNRKIIVIDYAGKQKKKSPIDRKDLELIIRSVKNRRSELSEDTPNENK